MRYLCEKSRGRVGRDENGGRYGYFMLSWRSSLHISRSMGSEIFEMGGKHYGFEIAGFSFVCLARMRDSTIMHGK